MSSNTDTEDLVPVRGTEPGRVAGMAGHLVPARGTGPAREAGFDDAMNRGPMTPISSYLICTLPRAGGWLLGEGLRRLGSAGVPDEYFADDLRAHFRRSWELAADCSDRDYLTQVARAGTSKNGVFSAMVQWTEMERLVQMLRPALGDQIGDDGEPPV